MSILHKKLRWAIIGAPSSGKTYLLSDLIQAFDLMGFKQEPMPLTAPYSSFGAFFAEISGANGQVSQTERYACRMEDRYNAVFAHPKHSMSVEVDFLNLPGETFLDPKRIGRFNILRKNIGDISNAIFIIETYTNPAGRERHVVRCNRKIAAAEEGVLFDRHDFYMNRAQLLNELKEDGYQLKDKESVNGHQLLKRFFDIEADSFYDTLVVNWTYLFPGLSLAEYKAQNVIFYFYPLMYCTQATDIILCDKLFIPNGGTDSKSKEYDLGKLIKIVGDFVARSTDHHPNAYLAFRGADFMLHNSEKLYRQYLVKLPEDVSPHRKRHDLYTLFCLSLINQLYGQTYETDANYPVLADYADINGGNCGTLTGMDLATHLDTRFGRDLGYGFWNLLNQTQRTGLLSRINPFVRKSRSIETIFNDPQRIKMPPHVYFTATPIDEEFCIYRNDPDDVSRFIHESNEKIRALHIEIATHGMKSMCWGSFQLLDDILTRNGIVSPAAKDATPLLNYFKGL